MHIEAQGMKGSRHEIEVIPGEPFCNDELGRLESGNALKNFVGSLDWPTVVCLDAPWGQGKTTFLLMWQQLLKDSGFPTLYFNAWENDFSQDALVALIGEIGASMDALVGSGDRSTAEQHLNNAKSFGAALLRRSLPVAARIATAGALDLDKITEQAIGGLTEAIVKDAIDKYEGSKRSMTAFRESLEALAATFSDRQDPRPLIFIIDELDRCRPTFAIEVLEKAKHLFNVSNIVFVLGLDKEQLGHSIRAVYGPGLNVSGYLRRFIDYDYLLPPPEKGMFTNVLFKRFGFFEYFEGLADYALCLEGDRALWMFSELFEVFDLSLREQIYCCSLLDLAIRTTPENRRMHSVYLCFLIVLKVADQGLYSQYINLRLQPADLLNVLAESHGMQGLLNSDEGAVLEAYIALNGPNERFELEDCLDHYAKRLTAGECEDFDRDRNSRIMALIKKIYFESGKTLRSLVRKIEVADRFRT